MKDKQLVNKYCSYYDCSCCGHNGMPLKPVYMCKSCQSEPDLLIEGCYEIFHTKVDITE